MSGPGHDKDRNSTALCAAYVLEAVQRHLITQATTEAWMRYYCGDTVAFSRTVARLMSSCFACSLIADPIISAFCDSFGRKSVMLLRPFSTLGCRAIQLYGMNHPSTFVVTQLITCAMEGYGPPAGLLGNAFRLGWESSLADMFGTDLVQLAGWQSWMNMMPASSAMATPILAGWLTLRSLRIPYQCSIVCCICNAVLVSCVVKETLPKHERRKFSIRRATNLLSFMKLLRRGAQLRRLVAMELLFLLGGMRAIFTVSDALRTNGAH